jgi:hypothetical protein
MWESLVSELLGSVVGFATLVGAVAGAGASFWLASVSTGSPTVSVIALFTGLIVGAKGTHFVVSAGIEWLERWANRSA